MSQWGESILLGVRDVGPGAGLWLHLCHSPAAQHAGTPARLKGCPGSLLVGRGPFRNKLCVQHVTGITATRVRAEMNLGTTLHSCFHGEKTRVPMWPHADVGDASLP